MNVEERVKKVIIDQLGFIKYPGEVIQTADLVQDLGADSLDMVELLMEAEEEFDIEVNDEDAEKIKTVGDAIQYFTDPIGW